MTTIDTGRLVAATADNLAAWHDTNLRALGYRTRYEGGLWLTLDRVPVIFFSAIAIRPGAELTAADALRRDGWASASDPWRDLDLESRGFHAEGTSPWMVRPTDSSARPGEPSPGLSIERVVDQAGLADFEAASAEGFGGQLPGRFTWAAPDVLRDRRMQVWVGRVGGRVVSGSMAFVQAGVVAIYAVSTIPEFRGRGYATALTWQAVMADPALPAVLQPSEMAEPLYVRLGFQRFASFGAWARPAQVSISLGSAP